MATDRASRLERARPTTGERGGSAVGRRSARRPPEPSVWRALDGLSAVQDGCRDERPPAPEPRPGADRLFVAATLAAALVVTAAVAVVVGARPVRAPSCDPITFSFRGSPPAYVVDEFAVAADEIRRRSGIVLARADPASSKLVVAWSDREVEGGAASPVVGGPGKARTLAFGMGRWRKVRGGRILVSASIEVDATRSWALGLDRGTGLAAVFVHELGHVIGLVHSAEPASFMSPVVFPERPRWTETDVAGLARAGRLSGCRR